MKPQNLFLNEKTMLSIVLFNVLIIFIQECGIDHPVLTALDLLCTVRFVLEMIVKHRHLGIRGYWRDGWNILDGTVTILSLPAAVAYFVPSMAGWGFVMAFRALRVFKLFRTGRHFPNLKPLWNGFKLALRQSAAFLLAYVVIILVAAMFNSAIFGQAAPQYFATPLDGLYAMFQMFTVEGWYEIPNAVAGGLPPAFIHLVRIYFCVLLIGGGIIGMSLINSIFVDAMAADNNDDVKEQLSRLEEKVDRLLQHSDHTAAQ